MEQLREIDVKKGVAEIMRFAQKTAEVRFGVTLTVTYAVEGFMLSVPRVPPVTVMRQICSVLGVTPAEIAGASRCTELVNARMIIVKLIRQHYPHITCTKLALLLGKDHTSILHYDSRFNVMVETEPFHGSYVKAKYLLEKYLKNKLTYGMDEHKEG